MKELHCVGAAEKVKALYAEFFDGAPTPEKMEAMPGKLFIEFNNRLNHTIICGVVEYSKQIMDIINEFISEKMPEAEMPFLLNGLRTAYLAAVNADHDPETAEMIKDIREICKENLKTVSKIGRPPEVTESD